MLPNVIKISPKRLPGLGVSRFLIGVGLFRAIDIMLLFICSLSLIIVVVEEPLGVGLTISNSEEINNH